MTGSQLPPPQTTPFVKVMTVWSLRTRNERKEEELEEEQSHIQSRRAFWSAGQRQLWVGISYMIPIESISRYTIGIISEVPTKL